MNMASKQKVKEKKEKQSSKLLWVLYAMFFLCIVAYAIYNNIFIGIAGLAIIILILVLEAKASVASEGIAGSVKEVLIALVAALAIWVALVVILGTSSPIDAVASCSMLPTLQRGDLVFLHGISNFSDFTSSQHIPTINMSRAQFSSFESSISTEFVSFYAYSPSNKSDITDIVGIGESGYLVGLYNNQCLSQYSYLGEVGNYYKCFVPSQQGSMLQYNYSLANITENGQRYLEISTSSISINGTIVYPNYTRPIIVYKTTSEDTFSGDIIHRAFAAINVNGTYYFLTKGDNNQALDIQFANYPENNSQIVGYVVLDVPIVGYVKLLLSGQLGSVPGCNMVTQIR